MRQRRILEGLEPLTAGDLDTAFAHYDEISRRALTLGMRRAALLMMGYIDKRRGRFDAALEHYARVTQPNRPLDRADDAANLSIASVHALRGQTVHLAGVPIGSQAARTMSSDVATIHCRAGRYDEVLRLKHAPLPRKLERHMAHERRVLALLQAFALTAMGADADQYVNAAAPALPGEFQYLGREWPDLERFIEGCHWPEIQLASKAPLPTARLL